MEALNIVIAIVVMVIAVWVAIFGGIGALLSRSRGASGVSGLAWGTALGPLGWLAIFWQTRRSAPSDTVTTSTLIAPDTDPTRPSTSAWDD